MDFAVAGWFGNLSSLCTFSSLPSAPASRGLPQHPSKDKSPPLFFFLCGSVAGETGWEAIGVVVGSVSAPDRRLEALPFRCLLCMLDVDSFEISPRLWRESVAVAPLIPDGAIGEFCWRWNDDRDGTCSRDFPFFWHALVSVGTCSFSMLMSLWGAALAKVNWPTLLDLVSSQLRCY